VAVWTCFACGETGQTSPVYSTEETAIATARATETDRELLDQLGSADLTDGDVAALQTLFIRTGALDDVEAAIERLVVESRAALADAPITETARAWLDELAAYVAWRDS